MMGTVNRASTQGRREISQKQQHAGRPIRARGDGRSSLRVRSSPGAGTAHSNGRAGPRLPRDWPNDEGDRPMMKLALSPAAAGLLRALVARAGIDRDRILLTDFRSIDWQS